MYVVSRDNDLLDLMQPRTAGSIELARLHPRLRILDPVAFLRLLQV